MTDNDSELGDTVDEKTQEEIEKAKVASKRSKTKYGSEIEAEDHL